MSEVQSAQERFDEFLEQYRNYFGYHIKAETFLRRQSELQAELIGELRRPHVDVTAAVDGLKPKERAILGQTALELFACGQDRADRRELATVASSRTEQLLRTVGYHGISYTPADESMGRGVRVRSTQEVNRDLLDTVDGYLDPNGLDLNGNSLKIINYAIPGSTTFYRVPLLRQSSHEPSGTFVITEEVL